MNVGQQTLEVLARARWYNQWLFSFIKPHLGEKVLEVGCGIGIFTSQIVRAGKNIVAIDIEHAYIDKIKSQFKTDKLTALWGDIEQNKFSADPGVFDTVVCLNVLEHIGDDKKALKNIFNRLSIGGGKLILLVPALSFLYGSLDEILGHKRRYSKKELTQKLEDLGFRILDLRFLNLLGAFGWFLNGKIFRRQILPSVEMSLFNFLARPILLLEKILPPPFGLSILVVAQKL